MGVGSWWLIPALRKVAGSQLASWRWCSEMHVNRKWMIRSSWIVNATIVAYEGTMDYFLKAVVRYNNFPFMIPLRFRLLRRISSSWYSIFPRSSMTRSRKAKAERSRISRFKGRCLEISVWITSSPRVDMELVVFGTPLGGNPILLLFFFVLDGPPIFDRRLRNGNGWPISL